MDVAYRFAGSDDIETLIRLRFDYMTEDRGRIPENEAAQLRTRLDSYFRRCIGTSFHAVLAEKDGRAVAAAYLSISEKPANPAFITGKIGTITNVYTRPDFRNQGIATRMLTLLIERSRECELSRLELSATEMGKSLYAKLGFSPKNSKYTDMLLRLI